MANPILAVDSRLDADTLTSSIVEDAVFPLANIKDDRLFTLFKPSTTGTLDIKTDAGVGNTVDVDYLAIIAHDLNTQGASIVFAHSADDISYTTIIASFAPSNDKIIFRVFTKVTRRFFRLRITGATAAVSIGQIQWGLRVESPNFALPRGYDPLSERVQFRSTRTQEGNVAGVVQGFTERLNSVRLELLPNSFVNGTAVGQFKEFWDNSASKGKAFVWAWNSNDPTTPDTPSEFEQDAYLAVISNDAQLNRPLRTQNAVGFRDIEFPVVGLKE